ncbi:DUF803-domain-containing protein [Microthyrium microscopicum]|uniref:DUF803-domain-containing protein n=1 Tax=Microthyrium microscopicum TaxID=703497 RepID=A0A6A6U2K7_9PEZI|nr:DUF803-domain-containing protein [Microthyrium microscopicum]
MKIPASQYAAASVFQSTATAIASVVDNGGKRDRESFNSIIGVVTAICGNVLISIALNTQRYAHLRLNEQWLERRRLIRKAERRREAAQTAKERRRNGEGANGRAEDDTDGEDEREPLLGSYRSDQAQADHDSEPELKEDEAQKSYLSSPYWWAGIITMTIGEAGNFLAYGFAPASIVSPLGVVAIISNCIIAPFFMKERFRWRDLIGVLISVAGAVTVVFSANESNPKLGPDEIWSLITTWEFETYLGITSLMICALMLASNKYGDKSIFIDLGLVGLFGGYTALSTKGVASLLSYTLFQALTFPVTYLLVIVLVGTAVMQIKYVNRALQRFEATQVIPTQFVMFTLCVILGSAVLYRDFEKTPGDEAGEFIGGCAMTFIGVWLITSARPRPSDDDEEFDDEDEEAIRLREGDPYQDDLSITEVGGSRVTLDRSVSNASSMEHNQHRKSMASHRSDISLPESLERNHWDSAAASGTVTPARPTIVTYGTTSDHSTGPLPLNGNPWISAQESDNKQKSSIQRFLAPLVTLFPGQRHTPQTLPSVLEARHSSPDINAIESDSPLPYTPRTPRNNSHSPHHSQNHLTPGPTISHRHSITNIYPAPFTSPLSSSLSAVVADSLRRGMSRRGLRSRHTTRPRIPNMPSNPQTRLRGNSESEASADYYEDAAGGSSYFDTTHPSALRRSRSEDDDDAGVEIEAANERRKSFSARLGSFLKRNKMTPQKGTDNAVGSSSASQDDLV